MTDAQKLEALVGKAVGNQWAWWDFERKTPGVRSYFPDYLSDEMLIKHIAETMNDMRLEHLLFNHDFARALFGERKCNCTPEKMSISVIHDRGCPVNWPYESGMKYHLQQAVLLPTPSEQIDYMYKAVFGE